jgi:O-antigen ligase
VRVTNTGRLAWRSTPEAPYVLVSRWYDDGGRALSPEGVRTALPAEVAPGESVEVDGLFVAPEGAGAATLVWDLYLEHRLRFSERGSRPGLVAVAIGASLPPAPPGPVALSGVYTAPSRSELWRAAIAMWSERPVVGFGPDAYRLTYGRFLGLEEWDHRVYANNLWLELLATTGALGAGAFLVLLVVAARRAWTVARDGDAVGLAAVAALVVFLAHGLVDYFLAFTVGYAAFWAFVGVVVGISRAEPQSRGGAE